MQTVHKPSKEKDPGMLPGLDGGDTFYPVSKTPALLTFNMEMSRDDDWEEDGGSHEGNSGEASESEEKFCPSESEENRAGRDLFIVSMEKTTISVLKARGGEDGCGCPGCLEGNCMVNDVIVVAESSRVTLGKFDFSLNESPLRSYSVISVLSLLPSYTSAKASTGHRVYQR